MVVERNSLVDAYGKKIVPHGLRHNFATVGIRAGMDIASLALMMGHTSRAMTLDTYGDAKLMLSHLQVKSLKIHSMTILNGLDLRKNKRTQRKNKNTPAPAANNT